jgi:glycosyltransferase involved in cell wall biosynthesis
MRIAINTRFLLSSKMEGFGWFTYEVVKRIVTEHPEHDFFFFFDRAYDEKFIFAENVTPIVLKPQARHPILFKIWFNNSVTKALKKHDIDLFFSPDGYLSLKTGVPQVGVIHDLNFEHYPEDLPKSALKYLKKYFPLFAKEAKHIVTVSHYSKKDICETYKIAEDKITVAHNGASELFIPLSLAQKESVKSELSNNEDYFVFVGALHARKNVQRLFEAFDIHKSKSKSKTKLVIVGEKLWNDKNLEKAFSKMVFQADVIFTGHLPIKKLTQVVGGAKALVFPSYFEGFGIPLVEAMKAETAVICGDRTSLPEVVENAGLLVDPFSSRSIADGLAIIDQEESFRLGLIEKGKERAKKFSWDFTAEKIWNVLEQQLKN